MLRFEFLTNERQSGIQNTSSVCLWIEFMTCTVYISTDRIVYLLYISMYALLVQQQKIPMSQDKGQWIR